MNISLPKDRLTPESGLDRACLASVVDLSYVGLAGMTKNLVRGPRTISLPSPEHRAPAGARRMRDVYLLA
jgi:hypothetical protein